MVNISRISNSSLILEKMLSSKCSFISLVKIKNNRDQWGLNILVVVVVRAAVRQFIEKTKVNTLTLCLLFFLYHSLQILNCHNACEKTPLKKKHDHSNEDHSVCQKFWPTRRRPVETASVLSVSTNFANYLQSLHVPYTARNCYIYLYISTIRKIERGKQCTIFVGFTPVTVEVLVVTESPSDFEVLGIQGSNLSKVR